MAVLFLVAVGAASIAGCGGGGSSTAAPVTPPNTAGKAQGVYSGATSTGETFESIILPNDTYYALYGTTTGNTFNVSGMMTGQGASGSGTYSATVSDFYYTGAIYDGSVNATYTAGSSIQGTVTEVGNPTVDFSGTALPTSSFSYSTAAALSDISGAWTGQLFAGASAAVTIGTNGTISGSSQGCTFSGTAAPDSSGKNFFDVSFTYGASPCLLPNQTQTGIAIDYLLSDGVTRQVIAGVSDGSKNGNVFLSTRKSSGPSNPGSVAFVQSANFTSTATASSYSSSFGSPVSNGDLVAVAFWWNYSPGATIVSVTDSAGNTYTPVLQAHSTYSNDWSGWIYAAHNVAGGSNLTITVKVSYANADQFSMAILEYSGVSTVDGISTNGGTSGNTVASGYVSTTHANELILGLAVADVNLGAGSGYNSRFVSPYFSVEDKMVSSVGQYDAEFTTANSIAYEGWDAGVAAFY